MKKGIRIFGLLALVMMCVCMLTGCKKGVEAKFNLVEINGIPGVTASSYEYNYIVLHKNGKYEIENKIGSAVTKQSGTYKINDDEITFITKVGAATSEEVYKYDGKTLIMETTMQGYSLKLVFEIEK